MHDLHKSFVSPIDVFDGSTELRMRAQYSHLSHGYDDGIPGRLPGDTTLFSAVARERPGHRGKQTKGPDCNTSTDTLSYLSRVVLLFQHI